MAQVPAWEVTFHCEKCHAPFAFYFDARSPGVTEEALKQRKFPLICETPGCNWKATKFGCEAATLRQSTIEH